MNNESSQITMIWTSPPAYYFSKRLIEEKNLDCRVLLVELSEVEVTAAREVERGAKILIARGGAWNRIQRSIPIPMIAIRFSFSDFASAIDEASQYGDQIAMIVFSDAIVENAKEEYYYWKVKTIIVQVVDVNEARIEIKKLKKKGVSALIGGITIQRLAAEMDIPCILFGCNEAAILEAVYAAQKMLKLLIAQEIRYQTITLLLDHSSQGMMTLDKKGRITNINQVALRILEQNSKKEEIVGMKCADIFPFPELILGVLGGKYLYDYLIEYKNHYLALSGQPIMTGLQINGAIINIQDSEEIQAVENKIRRHSISKSYSAKYTFKNIIGRSKVIEEAKQYAMMYAGVDSTVMITGDSGVGKELFAQSIHNASSRRNQPFVAVNCAAFPESLLESILFGYEKGAFTGANPRGQAGIFEAAHKGTIFLDEIGEIPVGLQSRLLRVIQEREVTRLGSTSVIPVDVRIITATNRNLFVEVQKGNFRKDLYYRLSVLPLQIPALDERKEDIALLAFHFVERFSKQYGRKISSLSDGAKRLLEQHSYYGNIRELSNIVERAVIFAFTSEITEENIRRALMEEKSAGYDLTMVDIQQKDSLQEEKEKMEIKKALELTGGNYTKAAQYLKIGRTTLWRKIKKYGI